MFVKIDGDLVNLRHIKSLSEHEGVVCISLLSDYEYSVKASLYETLKIFKTSGLHFLKVNQNEGVVEENVLIMQRFDDGELLVIFKDGSEESFVNSDPLTSISNYSPELLVVPEDEENEDET